MSFLLYAFFQPDGRGNLRPTAFAQGLHDISRIVQEVEDKRILHAKEQQAEPKKDAEPIKKQPEILYQPRHTMVQVDFMALWMCYLFFYGAWAFPLYTLMWQGLPLYIVAIASTLYFGFIRDYKRPSCIDRYRNTPPGATPEFDKPDQGVVTIALQTLMIHIMIAIVSVFLARTLTYLMSMVK